MARDESAFHNDCAGTEMDVVNSIAQKLPRTSRDKILIFEFLECDMDGFLILNFSSELAFRFQVADTDGLAGQAVLKDFNFDRKRQRAVSDDGVGNFSTNDSVLFGASLAY